MADAALRFILSVLITGTFTALVFVLVLAHPVESVPFRDVLLVLVGTLVGLVKDVYGFLFGSSTGSKDAQDTVKQLAMKSAENGERVAIVEPVAKP